MFLHAARVEFEHPATSETMRLEAPLATDLQRFAEDLAQPQPATTSISRWASSFDLLVFDWDGTLVDSAGHIVDSIQAACRDLGLPCAAEQRARHVIGLGLQRCAGVSLFPDCRRASITAVAERYRHHFLAGDHEVATVSRRAR